MILRKSTQDHRQRLIYRRKAAGACITQSAQIIVRTIQIFSKYSTVSKADSKCPNCPHQEPQATTLTRSIHHASRYKSSQAKFGTIRCCKRARQCRSDDQRGDLKPNSSDHCGHDSSISGRQMRLLVSWDARCSQKKQREIKRASQAPTVEKKKKNLFRGKRKTRNDTPYTGPVPCDYLFTQRERKTTDGRLCQHTLSSDLSIFGGSTLRKSPPFGHPARLAASAYHS